MGGFFHASRDRWFVWNERDRYEEEEEEEEALHLISNHDTITKRR